MTGEQWVASFCKAYGIVWDKLTAGEQFQLQRMIPCNIRCFRVGVSIAVEVNEKCPECGKPCAAPKTRYDHIREGGAL